MTFSFPKQGIVMRAPASDQNLIFGVIALQMDFVDRDALLAGMNRWLLVRNEKSLGEVLVDAGSLGGETRDLLDALVQRQVGAAAQVPAASSHASTAHPIDGAEASPPSALDTTDVVPPNSATDDGVLISTVSFASGPKLAGRYRVIRPHASGGLGEVFVATDAQFSREVALKEIRRRHVENVEQRRRFVLEARITGGLEHPGIVPVYDLGMYSDGRPYYVMRFIRGATLADAIKELHGDKQSSVDLRKKSLDLHKLLARFVDVCDAIEYAHSRGVIHRDIKPGNIMLGKFGETLVVDWGLAKAKGTEGRDAETSELPLTPEMSADAIQTVQGSALGTPAYMSPEQASGRLDLVGPGSDIYSLGATLYSVLTGTAPYAGSDVGLVLDAVRRGAHAQARSVNPTIAPPLDSICRKAMSINPADRYFSARELADDVERWMAGTNVNAHRPLFSEKAGRWLKERRGMAMVGAAALVVGLVVCVAAYFKFGKLLDPPYDQSLLETAFFLDDRKEYALAEKYMREALDIRRRASPPNEVGVSVCLVGIGNLLKKQGKAQEAEPLLREALEIRLKHLGPSHALTGNSQVSLGGAALDRGNLDEAEALLLAGETTLAKLQESTIWNVWGKRQAVSPESKKPGAAPTRDPLHFLVQARRGLVELYEKRNRSDKADQYRSLLHEMGSSTK